MSSSRLIRQHEFWPVAIRIERRYRGHVANGDIKQGAQVVAEVEEDWRERLRTEAQEQARKMLEEARRQAELIIEQAYQEGWQQGYQKGIATARAEMDEAVQTLKSLAGQARIGMRDLAQSAESQVVELALAIARKILERELALSPEAIVSMARAALQEVAEATPLRMRIHPDSLPILTAHLADTDIDLVADPDLKPGDCIIDTGVGRLDARVETKLAEMAIALGIPTMEAQP